MNKSRNMLLVLNFSSALTRPFHEYMAWPMAWPGMASGHHGPRPLSGSPISDTWPQARPASGRRFRPRQAMAWAMACGGPTTLMFLATERPGRPRRPRTTVVKTETGQDPLLHNLLLYNGTVASMPAQYCTVVLKNFVGN